MLLLIPLGVLLAGVGVLLGLSLFPRAPYAAPVAVTTLLLALVAVLGLGLSLPVRAVLSSWAPAELLQTSLELEADGPAWLLAAGLGAAGLATVLTGLARPGGRRLAARGAILLLCFTGLAALFSANLVTVVMAWAGLDLVYFAILILIARGEGVQPQAALHLTFSSLGTLAALAAAVLGGPQGPEFTWQAASVSPTVALLVTLAAVFRLGLFPLHLGLPVEANIRQGLGTLLRLVPATVALLAVARLAALGALEPARPWLTVFGAAAALVGAIQLWNSDDVRQSLTFVVIAHSGLALLAGLWSGPLAGPAVIAQALTLLLGGALLYLGNGWDEKWRWLAVFPAIGAAGLAGLPLTSGFFGVNQLIAALGDSGRWGLWASLVAVVIAQALLSAGLLRVLTWSGEPIEGGPLGRAGWVAGLAVLALAVLAVGGLTGPASELQGAPVAAFLGLQGPWHWAGLVLSLAAAGVGALLWRLESMVRTRTETAAEAVLAILRLEWLYRLVWGAIRLVDRLLFNVAGVLEGEGALLWALAMALAVLILLRT